MKDAQIFTHDYTPRDHEIVEYSFREHDALPGMVLRGPAVDIENQSDYFTCIGAAQTLGVYVSTPFPELLTQQLGMTSWNLGIGGASPYFLLRHPEVFKYINKGKFGILQVMTARDEPNERFEPTPVASIMKDLKRGDIVGSGDAWQRVMNEEPENAAQYVAQSRANWEKHMAELISKITVPIIHFWFSPKPLDSKIDTSRTTVGGIIDTFPQFINGENLSYIDEKENPLVTCFSDRDMEFDLRSRYTGKVVEVDYAVLDRSGKMPSFKENRNFYYPSPQMHWDAAITLGNVIKERVLI